MEMSFSYKKFLPSIMLALCGKCVPRLIFPCNLAGAES